MSAIKSVIRTYEMRTGNVGSAKAAWDELGEIIQVLMALQKSGRFDNGDKKCPDCGAWEYEPCDSSCKLNNLLGKLVQE